jgi:thiol-disulfide isomerase/thioredoxin
VDKIPKLRTPISCGSSRIVCYKISPHIYFVLIKMFESTPVLLYTQEDFELRSIQNDTALCLKNPKTTFSLVFFYGPGCEHCNVMRPIFSRNSGMLNDCTFIMVNLKNNQNLVHISKDTKTPIKYVPYILLFHKELPLFEYNGKDYSDEQLRLFLSNSLSMFSQRQAVGQEIKAEDIECENGTCYASFQKYADSSSGPGVCHLLFENAYMG